MTTRFDSPLDLFVLERSDALEHAPGLRRCLDGTRRLEPEGDEPPRRFARRVLRKLRSESVATAAACRISYVLGDDAHAPARRRLLHGLLAALPQGGALRLIGSHTEAARVFSCLDDLCPRLSRGKRLEARLVGAGAGERYLLRPGALGSAGRRSKGAVRGRAAPPATP